MSTSSSQLLADVAQLHVDAGLMHNIIHGTASQIVTTDGGPVKSAAYAVQSIMTFTARGAWATGTAYSFKDLYTDSGQVYMVLVAHTSTTISADMLAGKVALYQGNTADRVTYADTNLADSLMSRINRTVDSIAALRALDKTKYTRAFVTGYYGASDGGGGAYQLDPDDTSSTDNGGTVIVATDGARWKLQYFTALSLKQFGAKIDGTTQDTTAVINAIENVKDVYHPGGFCLVGPMAFQNLLGVRLKGVSRRESMFKLVSTGTMFKWSDCSDMQVIDLGFAPNAGLSNTDGMQFDGASSINTVDRCQFADFSLVGLTFVGTESEQISGNTLSNSLLLGCGVNNFLSVWSSDFFYHNNQFGVTQTGVVPQVGAYLQNSSAGTYTENYHWGNTVGFRHLNCNYNRIENNRFEESKQQGVYMNGCTRTIFSGNTIHTNSQQAFGGFDNAYFTNCDTLIVSGNTSFDWNNGATAHRYGFFFDVGCAAVELKGNTAPMGWNTAPYGFDASLATTKVQGDVAQCGVTGGNAIPAGQTTFFGAGVSNFSISGVPITAGRQCQLYRIFVSADHPPGVGQTYTYTLMKNGVSTGTVLTIAGASTFAAEMIQNGLMLLEADSYCLKLDVSAAATASFHRCSISQVDY
jgi:parallel beta-helix repeat protein